jgi:hypothetical protein
MTAPPPAVRRDAHGRLLPGGPSLNPGGRTSALAEVRELLRPNVQLYVDRLNELVRNPDPDIALPALREAFDRLLGKPVQSVESDVRTLHVNETIRQLYLQAVQSAAPTIEADGPTTILEGKPVRIASPKNGNG